MGDIGRGEWTGEARRVDPAGRARQANQSQTLPEKPGRARLVRADVGVLMGKHRLERPAKR
jgi:hypothetical protein